jgi:chromosome segregation ATPase
MSLRWIIPRLIGRLGAVLLISAAFAADDPAAQFLQAYQEFRAGERFEQQAKPKEAAEQYESAVKQLELVKRRFPEFEPVVIDFRLRKSRENLSRLESATAMPFPDLPSSDLDGGALPEFSPPAPLKTRSPAQTRSIPRSTYRIPMPPLRTPTATRPSQQPTVSTAPLVMQREIAALRLQLRQAEQRAADMNEQLLQTMAREQSALHEIDRTKVVLVDLRSQLAQSRQSIGDLKDSNESLQSKTESFTDRLGALETDLETARADLEVAEDYNSELFQKLESAATYIASSDEIREELVTERNTLHERFKSGMDAEMTRLVKETEKLAASRDELTKKVEAAALLADAKESAEKELTEARSALASAETNGTALEEQIATLRKDINALVLAKKSAEESLAAAQQERDAAGDSAEAKDAATKELQAQIDKMITNEAEASARAAALEEELEKSREEIKRLASTETEVSSEREQAASALVEASAAAEKLAANLTKSEQDLGAARKAAEDQSNDHAKDLETLGNEINVLTAARDSAGKELAAMQAELETARKTSASVPDLNTKLAEFQKQATEAEQREADARKALADIQARLTTADGKLEAERVTARNKLATQSAALDQLHAEMLVLTEARVTADTEKKALEGKLAAAQSGNESVDGIEDQLASATRELADARKLESATRESVSALESQLAKVRSAATADRETAAATIATQISEIDRLKAEVGTLTDAASAADGDLTALKVELAAAREKNETAPDLEEKLAAATINATATKQRQLEATEALVGLEQRLAASDGQNKTLAAESESARAEVKQLTESAEATAARLAALDSANTVLSQRLLETESRLKDSVALAGERDKAAEELRTEIESNGKKLSDMTEELAGGQARIADLENQLEATSAAAASATSAIAQENALLRGIVNRSLREEQNRQDARRRIESELTRLQIQSSKLLSQLDAMTRTPTLLDDREQKLFAGPPPGAGGGGSNAIELVAEKPAATPDAAAASPSTPDLPPELLTRAAEANDQFRKGNYDAAIRIYESIAASSPSSYLAAVNLGVAQLRAGDYSGSGANLAKALNIRPGDAFALTHLGIALFREGKMEAAAATLQEASKSDPRNHLAPFFRGLALSRIGDRIGAMRELERSITNNPDYAQAHFNLALLLATAEPKDIASAKIHYEKAVGLGAAPDPVLEDLLK